MALTSEHPPPASPSNSALYIRHLLPQGSGGEERGRGGMLPARSVRLVETRRAPRIERIMMFMCCQKHKSINLVIIFLRYDGAQSSNSSGSRGSDGAVNVAAAAAFASLPRRQSQRELQHIISTSATFFYATL